jgi:hypothetical protein
MATIEIRKEANRFDNNNDVHSKTLRQEGFWRPFLPQIERDKAWSSAALPSRFGGKISADIIKSGLARHGHIVTDIGHGGEAVFSENKTTWNGMEILAAIQAALFEKDT